MCIVYFTLLLLSVGWTESATITRTLSLGFGGEHGVKWGLGNPIKGFSDFISDMTEPVGHAFNSYIQEDNNDTTVESPNNQTTSETTVQNKTKPTIDYSNRVPVVEEKIKKVKAFVLCVVNDQYNCGQELGGIDIMKHLGPPPNATDEQKTLKNHPTTTEKIDVTTTDDSKTMTIGKKTAEGQETTTHTTTEPQKGFTTTFATVPTTEEITTEQPTEQPTTLITYPETSAHRVKTKAHHTTENPTDTTVKTKSSKKASTKKVTSTGTTTPSNSPVLKSGYQRKQGGLGLYPADYLNFMEDEPAESTTHQKHIKYKDIANDNSSNLEPGYDATVTSESTKTTREVKEEDAITNSFFGDKPLFAMEDLDTEKKILQEKSIIPEQTSGKENVTIAGTEENSTSPEVSSDKENTTVPNPEEKSATPDNETISDKENATTPEEKSTTSSSSKKEDEDNEEIPPIPDIGEIFSKENSDTGEKPDDSDSSDKKKTEEKNNEERSSQEDSSNKQSKEDKEDSSNSDNAEESAEAHDEDNDESESSKDIFGDSSDTDDIMEASSSDKVITVTEKGLDKKLPVKEPRSSTNNTTTFFVYSIPVDATSTEISVVTQVSVKKNHHDNKTKEENEPKLTQAKKYTHPIHVGAKEHVAH